MIRSQLKTKYSADQLRGAQIALNEWLKVSDDDAEKDLVLTLIEGALIKAEQYCNLAILEQTYECFYDDFSNFLELLPANASSIVSIKYSDGDDVQQTLASTVYILQDKELPARVYERKNQYFPLTNEERNNVIVEFKAGWANWESLPEMLRIGMEMLCSHWYENRQDVVVGRSVSEIPHTSKELFDFYRIKTF